MDFKQARLKYLEEEFLNAILVGYIEEAGLSRVVKLSEKPFAILTAFRGDLPLKDNRARNRKLLQYMNTAGAGPHLLNGHWQEAPEDVDYEKAKAEGSLKDVSEESFFVAMPKDMDFERFKKTILVALKRYKQDAAILGDGDNIYVLLSSGKMDKIGTKISFNNIGQMYSKMKGRPKSPFVFEGVSQPHGVMSRMAFKTLGLEWFKQL